MVIAPRYGNIEGRSIGNSGTNSGTSETEISALDTARLMIRHAMVFIAAGSESVDLISPG